MRVDGKRSPFKAGDRHSFTIQEGLLSSNNHFIRTCMPSAMDQIEVGCVISAVDSRVWRNESDSWTSCVQYGVEDRAKIVSFETVGRTGGILL